MSDTKKRKPKVKPSEVYKNYGPRNQRWSTGDNPHLTLLSFNTTFYMNDEIEYLVRDGYFPSKSEAIRHFIMKGISDFKKELIKKE